MSTLALLTVAFAPGAAAHWGDDAYGSGSDGPAGGANKDLPHHLYVMPGSVRFFGLDPVLCFGDGPILGTHLGYNQDNLEWHNIGATGATNPVVSGEAGGGAGALGEGLAGTPEQQGGTSSTGEIVGPVAGGPHDHHDVGGGDSPFSVAVDSGGADTHRTLLDPVIGGIVLASEVRTPQQPASGDINVPSDASGGMSSTDCDDPDIAGGDRVDDPLGLNSGDDDDANTDPEPDNPEGAGITFGMDTGNYLWLDDRCTPDFGDNDPELAFGGAFITYSVLPGDASPPALTGCAFPDPPGAVGHAAADGWGVGEVPDTCSGCGSLEMGRVHGTFDETADPPTGYTGTVQLGDPVLGATSISYTVCFDENDNGVCTTSLTNSPDAFDLCQAEGDGVANVPVAVAAGVDKDLFFGGIFPDGVGSATAGYLGLHETKVNFAGTSQDAAMGDDPCWPRKATGTNIGVVSAAGPAITGSAGGDTDPRPIPNIPNNQVDNLVMFTSLCADDNNAVGDPDTVLCPTVPTGSAFGWVAISPTVNDDYTIAGEQWVAIGGGTGGNVGENDHTKGFFAGPVVVRHTSSTNCGDPQGVTPSSGVVAETIAPNTWAVVVTSTNVEDITFGTQNCGGTAEWRQAN